MTLEAKLKAIREKLEDNRNFPNESSISQGIVLPILQELNWDIFNTKVVRPENITLGKDRADFALCDDNGDLKVFIEVKRLGGVDQRAEKQVMGYAHDKKVRIAVLTDGKTWSLYLPYEAGGYEERQVFKLDLSERFPHSPQKSSEVLQRYLEQSRVVSSKAEALEAARVFLFLKKYREDNPDIWKNTVGRAIVNFEQALNFLAIPLKEKIEPKSAQDNIIDYFHSLLREKNSQSSSGITEQQMQSEAERQDSSTPTPIDNGNEREKRKGGRNQGSRRGELVILGKSFHYSDAKGAMVLVFKELQKREPGFYQRFYNDPQNHGRTRRTLAQDPRELYDRTHLAKNYERIGGNWVIGTNNSNLQKEKIIKIAAEVAGLKFGRDIIVNFDASLQRQEGQIPAPPPSGASDVGRRGELVILGKSFHYRQASEAMVIVFKELERRESGFWQRFYNDPQNHGKTRRIIAQDARRLYDYPHLAKFHKQLGGNWVIATNNSKLATEKNIRIAAEVAGLKFGRDIIVNFDA